MFTRSEPGLCWSLWPYLHTIITLTLHSVLSDCNLILYLVCGLCSLVHSLTRSLTPKPYCVPLSPANFGNFILIFFQIRRQWITVSLPFITTNVDCTNISFCFKCFMWACPCTLCVIIAGFLQSLFSMFVSEHKHTAIMAHCFGVGTRVGHAIDSN